MGKYCRLMLASAGYLAIWGIATILSQIAVELVIKPSCLVTGDVSYRPHILKQLKQLRNDS